METDEVGFVENGWVSRDVMLGSLRCRAVDPTKRCVMVTRAQGEIPQDRELIRTIYEHNDGNAGVALQMQESGVLHRGSTVEVLD